MRTLRLTALMRHRTDGIGRHPWVTVMDLGLFGFFYLLEPQTFGESLYRNTGMCLCLCSALLHLLQPWRPLRFLDQTSIAGFVLVAPMPAIYLEPWAVYWFGLGLTGSALVKLFELEPSERHGSVVFLGLGAVSLILLLSVGFPNLGVPIFSRQTLLVLVAIGFFLLYVWIFHAEENHLPLPICSSWQQDEWARVALLIAMVTLTSVLMEKPVL